MPLTQSKLYNKSLYHLGSFWLSCICLIQIEGGLALDFSSFPTVTLCFDFIILSLTACWAILLYFAYSLKYQIAAMWR
jgi:hypothetical protein